MRLRGARCGAGAAAAREAAAPRRAPRRRARRAPATSRGAAAAGHYRAEPRLRTHNMHTCIACGMCMCHVHVACDTSCALEGLTARLLQVCCMRAAWCTACCVLRVCCMCAACVLHAGVLQACCTACCLGGARLLGATQCEPHEGALARRVPHRAPHRARIRDARLKAQRRRRRGGGAAGGGLVCNQRGTRGDGHARVVSVACIAQLRPPLHGAVSPLRRHATRQR